MASTPRYDKRTKAYIEAERYMRNAANYLQKAGKDGNHYIDRKYVCTACGIAYRGVLLALDAFFEMRGVPPVKKGKRASIEYYTSNLAKIDGRMTTQLHDVYTALHIAGYYELCTESRIINAGLEYAQALIDRIKPAEDLPPEAFEQPSVWSRMSNFVNALFV